MSQYMFSGNGPNLAYVALGSNATSQAKTRSEVILEAIRKLPSESSKIVAKSRLFETPAFPPGNGPDFVNAVVSLETTLAPQALLAQLHAIEADFGRQRRVRWEARSLDLDLLAFGDHILPDRDTFEHWFGLPLERQMVEAPDTLLLPHPRLQDRGFVLVPLNDIAPDWQHPVIGKTVAEMLAALPEAEKAEILPIS